MEDRLTAKNSDSRVKFKPYLDELKRLRGMLRKKTWAKAWKIDADFYGEPKIRGAFLRMHKKRWPQDIHFECSIGNGDVDRGSVSVAFHDALKPTGAVI